MRHTTKPQALLLVIIGLCAGLLTTVRLFFDDALRVSYSFESQTPYEESYCYFERFTVTINLSDKKAILLVNGEPISAEKSEPNRYVLKLCEGDVVEMDLRKCGKNETYAYVIYAPDELSCPVTASKYIAKEGIVYLFKIQTD